MVDELNARFLKHLVRQDAVIVLSVDNSSNTCLYVDFSTKQTRETGCVDNASESSGSSSFDAGALFGMQALALVE